MKNNPTNNLKGMLWMVASGLCFIGVYIGVKLVGTRLPAAEAAFLRYAMGIMLLLPTVPYMIREGVTWPALQMNAVRGVVHTIAVCLWFFAMARLPMAEVAAMGYMTPVFVTIAAVIFFGETVAIRRILAICIALCGVVVILRPGFREIQLGHLAMLGTTLGFALSYSAMKKLTEVQTSTMIVGTLSIMVTIGLLPLALINWMTPTVYELLCLSGVALCATAGHFAMTIAFRNAPITVTQPMTFLQLIWSVSVGFLLFSEAIDLFVIIGGIIIIVAVIYITFREAQLKQGTLPE